MNKMIVIFSGYNQRAVVAFLRVLKKYNINSYVIIAASKDDTILLTDYKDNVFYIRKQKELNINEIIQCFSEIKYEYKVDSLLIAPSTEALNRFVLENRGLLEKTGCIIPLVNYDLYSTISDKESFRKLCIENNILVPKNIEMPTEFCSKFVAKPKTYISENGKCYSPELILNEIDFQKFKSNFEEKYFDIQEFIEGESIYLLFYFSNKQKVYKLVQRNLAQQFNGKSIIAAELLENYDEGLISEYEKLFLKCKFRGFVMVELRVDENGKAYMIEANPRFWGPSQLLVDANAMFFEEFLNDYEMMHYIPQVCVDYHSKYFWATGVSEDFLDKDRCCWFGEGRKLLKQSLNEFKKFNIYDRSDTYSIYKREKKLYE